MCQTKEILRNTAIALSFNAQTRYMIHFGATNWSEHVAGALGRDVYGDIEVHDFESTKMTLLLDKPIAEFELSIPEDKKKVQKLVKALLQIMIEDFNLLENSCHHYVLMAYGMILAFQEEMNSGKNYLNWDDVEAAGTKQNVEKLLKTNDSKFMEKIKELTKSNLDSLEKRYEGIAALVGG